MAATKDRENHKTWKFEARVATVGDARPTEVLKWEILEDDEGAPEATHEDGEEEGSSNGGTSISTVAKTETMESDERKKEENKERKLAKGTRKSGPESG